MDRENQGATWIFAVIGVAVTAIAALARLGSGQPWDLISEISLNVGITIIAVSLIDWIWRRVGGDPLLIAINELRSATALLSDLRDTGLKRMFLSRDQASEQKDSLRERMSEAREVDMMGIVLRSGWSSNPDFLNTLRSRTQGGKTKFRIMLFDPASEVAAQRAFEESGVRESVGENRIAKVAAGTLRTLLEIKNELPEEDKEALKIKVIQETNIYCSVIRVDDVMMVTKYLLHLSGSNSETLQVAGSDGLLFKLYQDEFETMWNLALDWPR